MVKYNRSEVNSKATKFGYIVDTYEKVMRLSIILKAINKDKYLKKALILKGGTAINLLLANLPRLSVDIDFDYNNNCNKEEMLKNRVIIDRSIKKYMASMVYTMSSKSKFTNSLDSYVYTYQNSSNNKDNIKIEINYSLRSHILKTATKVVSIDPDGDKFKISMLNPVELYASKITALINRAAMRDLFDIDCMLKNKKIQKKEYMLLKKSVIFYCVLNSNKEDLFNYKNISKLTEKQVKIDLHPVLRKGQKFNLDEAKVNTIKFLNELMVLTDKEKKFIDEFYKGNYEIDLLFKDELIIERLENHPMMIWKIMHIKDFVTRK